MKHTLYFAGAVAGSMVVGAVFVAFAFMRSSGEDDAQMLRSKLATS